MNITCSMNIICFERIYILLGKKKDVDAINRKALYGSAMKFTSLTNKQYTFSTMSIYVCKYFDLFLVLCHLHLLYGCVYIC